MSYNGQLCYPCSSCGSFYPSNLVYSTDLCSLSTCQQASSLYSGCQEACCEPLRYQTSHLVSRPCQMSCYIQPEDCFEKPTRCQTSLVVSSPCQMSCYCPRISVHCSPFWSTYPGSLGFRSNSFSSLSSGSRSCYSVGCESSSFGPRGYGICVFPSLSHGSRFCRPTYFASGSCHSSCYRPACGSGFYPSTC
uniref:Keratin-associated protein n=1 Tax=Sus scrofa TaxID=9823 RepID=A0A4X1SK66_PIG